MQWFVSGVVQPHLHVAMFATLTLAGCEPTDGTGPEPAPLRAFAFPNTVEPGGQATIAIDVALNDCQTEDTCRVCVALPPGGGQLFPPAGLDAPSGHQVSLQASSPQLLHSITYVAPHREGSEVVSVSAFRQGNLDCPARNVDDLLATTTVRIELRKPTDSANGAPPEGSNDNGSGAGGAAGSSAVDDGS